ncbi:glutathione S-transferase family protein [Corallococcus aberystwythensis]|uniref:Glutathione S-transferase family protein n=1 Tax=Corallococcus aberystwythensis TaxID=2316722 RepID=A0A3A8PWK8_9BACT|nr:glutathione S-transferase family protein [Corallococcus aberystwythensis]RKH59420.1 glutathione S-transferase family protein [Corallococcus aberystwythensis]
MITISAFKWVPPFAQGVVRDLRVRWALEEAGLPYEAMLIDPQVQKSSDYRAQQPFGQVPVFQEDGLTLFESGAILVHLGLKSDVLLPTDEAGRARALTWLFAALNSIEIHIQQLAEIDLFAPDAEWAKLHRPDVVRMIHKRLGELATWLGNREYLEDRFTVGDLMMSTVFRILRHTEILEAHPTLKAYKERCEARPAFQRALAAQLAPFQQHERSGA